MIKGIDISNWQGTVDCTKVKSAGYDIVYIKATEGMHTLDAFLEQHYTSAKNSGVKIGFYHFLQGNESGVDQANWMYQNIKDKDFDCRIAIDVEVTNGASPDGLSTIVCDFAEQINKLTGKEVVVYTYTNFANTNLNGTVSKYPLWIAEYGVTSPNSNSIWGSSYIGWQYSSSGQVDGCPVGNTDLDKFTEDILLASRFIGDIVTPQTKPEKSKQPVSSPEKIVSPYSLNENVIVTGSVYATGQAIPSWVQGQVYPIIQVDNGKVLLGAGLDSWVSNDSIKPVDNFKVGDNVRIIGDVYSTGQSIPSWVKQTIYPIIQVDSGKVLLGNGLDSWVNNNGVIPAIPTFEVGDNVKIIANTYATGQAIPNWVKLEVYPITQIGDNQCLLGNGLDSWVNNNGLVLA